MNELQIILKDKLTGLDPVLVANRESDLYSEVVKLLTIKSMPSEEEFGLQINQALEEIYGKGWLLSENVSREVVQAFVGATGLRWNENAADNGEGGELTPLKLLNYTYGLFHSRTYRDRYRKYLQMEPPRVLLPASVGAFEAILPLGAQLVSLHLLEARSLEQPITTYTGPAIPEVEKVSYGCGAGFQPASSHGRSHVASPNGQAGMPAPQVGTVWLDKKQTCGFAGVPEAVWNFHIGGYQVCNKWLKDRRGRTLSKDDIAHYQKIVVALAETIRLMKEIDEVIGKHGGWPGAFQTGEAPKAATAKVIPFRPRTVEPKPEERYVTCVPLVLLKAAAGAFSDPQHIEDDGFEWVAVESRHRLRPGMFVAQVVGKSMEPVIPDGAWCLFRAPVEGTRQGKTVLVQLRDAIDPESGQRYTVKRYESEKAAEGDSWRHERITLKPLNPDFDPIVLTGTDQGELQVIAELVEVLGGES